MADSTCRSSSATKSTCLARVLSNTALCREHFKLVLHVECFPPAEPGQFVQILCRDPEDLSFAGGALIRRPFSLAGLRRTADGVELDIIHRVVGTGTRWLARLQRGQVVSILGPLGKPFAVASDRPTAYLIGGGGGLPPMLWLAEAVRRAGLRAVAFCGARTADLLPLRRRAEVVIGAGEPVLAFEEFARFDTPAVVCTDDGSLGVRGMIPDVFERYIEQHAKGADAAAVYACGPEAMLRAVAAVCERRSILCQVCMERMMACGMGTCQSCVVPIRDAADPQGWRYRLCCTDGPVFDSREVVWED